jgi:PAS domain S-box-containing protein
MTTRRAISGGPAPARGLEDQLRETVQRYQLVFRATNEVLYDLNIETGAVIWNDGLFSQYGYDRSEGVSTLEWWAERIHPDDAFHIEEEFMGWLQGDKETWQTEYRFRKADDTYADVRDRAVVQRDQDGKPMRVIGSFLDITRQKQLDKAKDEFISLVSHQLRTPLTAIRLYSEMLGSGYFGELDKRQNDPVTHITDASIRLIDLVGNILDISKLESGHMVSNPTPVPINKLLELSLSEVQPLAHQKGVVIDFTPATNLNKVSVDSVIFGQVVHNLLTNAIRYTEAGHGRVKLAFERNDRGYLLTVQDNGIGIPESAQESIFNRFYRAKNAASVEEHGTGLGLYMIKLMLETAGCDVWFDSVIDHGTTFYVQLPKEGMKAG